MKIPYTYITIGLLIIAILFILFFKGCDSGISPEMYKASQDELKIVKDKHGRQLAITQTMEGTVKNLTKDLIASTATQKRLQEKANKLKNDLVAALAVDMETNDTSSGSTTVLPGEVIVRNDSIFVYPVYVDTISKPWISHQLYMDKDSSSVITSVKNSIDMSFHYERPLTQDSVSGKLKRAPFWKKKLLYGDVFTHNPNTGVKEMSSFHIQEPKKYTGLKIVAGVVLGLIGGKFLFQ